MKQKCLRHSLGAGLVASFFLFSYAFGSEGISTSFADVQVSAVPLGQPFIVRSSLGEGIRIKNMGKNMVRVHFQVLQPGPADLRGGAVPIPDTHWLVFQPETLDVPPQGEAQSNIVLTLPKGGKHRRKTYQATIWSHTLPVAGQGVTLGVGLLSRLRFTTADH